MFVCERESELECVMTSVYNFTSLLVLNSSRASSHSYTHKYTVVPKVFEHLCMIFVRSSLA